MGGTNLGAQHDVDERSPRPAVAVEERVDRLELRVRQRGLHDRRVVIAVQVGHQIVEQRGHMLRRRRDKRRVAWVVGAATDPVLLLADHTANVGRTAPGHQRAVYPAERVEGDGVGADPQRDGLLHAADVREHLDRDLVVDRAVLVEQQLRLDDAPRSGVEALDLRRSDRLGPQKKAREAFEADVACVRRVQPADRCLSVGDVGGDVGWQPWIPADERVWQVRVVGATAPVAPGWTVEAGLPAPSDSFGHPSFGPPLN
jgi:hypothetical protein